MPQNKRHSVKDLEGSIFKIDTGEMSNSAQPDEGRSVTAFTTLALEIDETDPKAYAKVVRVTSDGSTRVTYWAKRDSQGRFFNPFGLYQEGLEKKRIKGRAEYEFRAITRKAFDYYIQFLRSKNTAWFINAQREVG